MKTHWSLTWWESDRPLNNAFAILLAGGIGGHGGKGGVVGGTSTGELSQVVFCSVAEYSPAHFFFVNFSIVSRGGLLALYLDMGSCWEALCGFLGRCRPWLGGRRSWWYNNITITQDEIPAHRRASSPFMPTLSF